MSIPGFFVGKKRNQQKRMGLIKHMGLIRPIKPNVAAATIFAQPINATPQCFARKTKKNPTMQDETPRPLRWWLTGHFPWSSSENHARTDDICNSVLGSAHGDTVASRKHFIATEKNFRLRLTRCTQINANKENRGKGVFEDFSSIFSFFLFLDPCGSVCIRG